MGRAAARMVGALVVVCLALSRVPPAPAAGETLRMAFNERPPYHYSVPDDPAPRGLLADIVKRVVADAGLEVSYLAMETNRIMASLRAGAPLCSFGWFENEERLTFAKFSKALWQDEPFVVVFKKENETAIRGHARLEDLFRDPALRFGTRAGTSYNGYVDALKERSRAVVVEPANTQVAMVRMLAANRFHFMILVPAEIGPLFAEAGVDPGGYAAVPYPEMPPGGRRRIMCGKAVPDGVITRLNGSIAKFVDPRLRE